MYPRDVRNWDDDGPVSIFNHFDSSSYASRVRFLRTRYNRDRQWSFVLIGLPMVTQAICVLEGCDSRWIACSLYLGVRSRDSRRLLDRYAILVCVWSSGLIYCHPTVVLLRSFHFVLRSRVRSSIAATSTRYFDHRYD